MTTQGQGRFTGQPNEENRSVNLWQPHELQFGNRKQLAKQLTTPELFGLFVALAFLAVFVTYAVCVWVEL